MMVRYHQNVSTKVLLHYSTTETFDILTNTANIYQPNLARIFLESLTTTIDMAVRSCVLGCYALRRTIQVRFGPNTLRLPDDTPIFMVS
jgi:hypothetical protein